MIGLVLPSTIAFQIDRSPRLRTRREIEAQEVPGTGWLLVEGYQ